MTDRGLTLRPKGAEALLHRKGEPRPMLNRQGDSRRCLTRRMEGSHATEGSQRLCCTGRESLVRRRVRSETQTTDGGSRGSAAPEGEPRPMLNKQIDATDGGTLAVSEGSRGSAAPEGRDPLAAEYKARFGASDGGLPQCPKGACDSAAPGVRAPSATERAVQLKRQTEGSHCDRMEPRPCCTGMESCLMLNKQKDATDGGTLTASEGSCGSAAPEGRVPLAAEYEAQFDASNGGLPRNRRGPATLLHRE